MAASKAMGTGWKIQRSNEVIGGKPPMAKWSSLSGSTRTGTTKAEGASYQRWVGPQEEAGLIKHNWVAERATPSIPKAPKVRGTFVSAAPSRRTLKTPARAVMHTPTTTGTSYAGPKPEDLMGQAADELFPGVSTTDLNKLLEPEKKSIIERAYKLEEEHREGRRTSVTTAGVPFPETRLHTPTTSPSLDLEIPELKSPSKVTPALITAGAVGLGYKAGVHKPVVGVVKAPFKIARGAFRLATTGSVHGSMPKPSAAASRLLNPTGTAPPVNPAGKASTGMPAASQSAPAALPKPAGIGAPAVFAGPRAAMPSPSTRTPAATATPPPGAALPTPAAKPKIEQAMDLARQIQGEKLAVETAKNAAHEARVADVIKQVTKETGLPASSAKAGPVKAGKKPRPSMAPVEVVRHDSSPSSAMPAPSAKAGPVKAPPNPNLPSYDFKAAEKHEQARVKNMSLDEAAVERDMQAETQPAAKPAPVAKTGRKSKMPAGVTTPKPAAGTAAPDLHAQLAAAHAENLKLGGQGSRLPTPSTPKPAEAAISDMPKPSSGAPVARAKGKPKMPEGVTPSMPAPPAQPAPAVQTDFQKSAAGLADEIRGELRKPQSAERDVKLNELKSRGKDLIIKQGGISLEETPAGQRAPQKTKTKLVKQVPSSPAPAKPSAAEAARMAVADVDETGVVKPISPPKPEPAEGPSEYKTARAQGVAAQYKQARAKLADVLPDSVKNALKKIGDRGHAVIESSVEAAPVSTRTAPEASLDQDVRTARIRRRSVGPTPTQSIQPVGPRRGPPPNAAPKSEEPMFKMPQKRKAPAARTDANIPEGQEDFVTEAAQKAQRKAQAARGRANRPQRVEGVNIDTEVALSMRGESPTQAAERLARKTQIEQAMKTKGYTRVETQTVEQELMREKPVTVRVGPAAAPAAPAAEGAMPTPASKTKTVKAPKVPKAPKVNKEPGRFRFPKPKGRGAKAGLLGGVLLAATAASEAHAAEPGQRLAAAGGSLKEGGKAIARDVAITAGLGVVPGVGPALAAGYVGYRTAEGAIDVAKMAGEAIRNASGWGFAAFNAYKERRASESKFGEAQYQAALSKQRKKGLI